MVNPRELRFEFATANRILFGNGVISDAPSLILSMGQRVFVVADSSERCGKLIDSLVQNGLDVDIFIIKKEPDVRDLFMAMRSAQVFQSKVIVGFGGGAALDTGKAVAVLLKNPGPPNDYFEVIGKGRVLKKPSLPYIAIPTTSGTGSEVTRNAVITIPDSRMKVSLRSLHMLPKLAIVDPTLTLSLPQSITANTGMDALTQLIEPFVCNFPSPLTDALCRDGISKVACALETAWRDGQNIHAREEMSLASLFGGLALANARLGAVHGMANPIGGRIHAPHGAICARLLPLVMKANIQALRRQGSNSLAIDRYSEIAFILTYDKNTRAEDGAELVQKLCKTLNIRPLSEYGLGQEDIPILVEQSQKANSMKGNPVKLTDEELRSILEEAY